MAQPFLTPRPSGPMASATYAKTTRKPRIAASLALILTGLVVSLILLASQTHVPQVVRAPGALTPFGDYAAIETLEGGIVEEVLVSDGDAVRAGEVMIVLRNPALQRDHAAMAERRSAVLRQLANRQAVLSALQDGTAPPESALAQMEVDGLTVAAADLALFTESQQVFAASAAQQRETIAILIEARDLASERIARQESYLAEQETLLSRGLIVRSAYLTEVRLLDAASTAASDAAIRLAQAENQLSAIQAEQARERLQLMEETLNEIERLTQELAELDANLMVTSGQLQDMRIAAPSAGIIQTQEFVHAGEVIEPGQTLFELLPMGRALIVEARIPSADIGHIQEMQSASVTIDTFDVRRVGRLEGQVAWVSPLPIVDERTGEAHFRIGVEIDADSIGDGSFRRDLQAGMTAVVEITSGDHSLLAYLLRPVHQTLTTAFTER